MKKLTVLILSVLYVSGMFAQMRVLNDGRAGFGRYLQNNRGIYIGDAPNAPIIPSPFPFSIIRDRNDLIQFGRSVDGSAANAITMARFGQIGMGFALSDYNFSAAQVPYNLLVSTNPSFSAGLAVNMWEGMWGGDGIRVSSSAGWNVRFFAAYSRSIFGWGNTNITPMFYVNQNGAVWARGGFHQLSDASQKRNIETISSPLEKLMQIQGVRFDFVVPEENARTATMSANDRFESAREATPELTREIFDQIESEQSRQRLGLIAQEVEKVFPELVRTQEDGLKAVAYAELVPVLIEAIRELHHQIEELRNPSIIRPRSAEAFDNTDFNLMPSETREAVLHQNVPNPFSQSTQIGFYLPETVRNASLIIFDMTGKQLMQIPLTQRGDGMEFIQGSQLSPGIYLYALIADGREVGVKRMILTQ